MRFFIHSLFMTSFVWMLLHFWRQLPLQRGETKEGRLHDFIESAGKGVALPVFVWFLANLGLSRWVPPFVSRVDFLKTEAAITGEPWFWLAVDACSPAMSVIVSFWAALSLIQLAVIVRSRLEDPSSFNTTLMMWSGFMLPVGAVILFISGWAGIGFALVVVLAPVVNGVLTSLMPLQRTPSYSQAIARMKFGKYSEAEWEVIKELEQCDSDFNGWMMLAELYAVHFHNFEQAEQTVMDLCDQPNIAPSDACVALHRLADWCLQLQNDPPGARRCMEAISKRYPKSHLDRMARLRLKRMPHTTEDWIEESSSSKQMHLPALHDELEAPEYDDEVDVEGLRQRAERLSRKLSRDPNDASAREDFAHALLKLDKWQGAIDQVDLLLAMEGQPKAQRAQWMGLKAAWLLKHQPGEEAGRNLLVRIGREFPESPQAMAAKRRILLMEEQKRVAKYSGKREKPRIVIRLDDSQEKD